MGEVAIYTEDCLAGMRQRLEPGSVDVIVTSPPYNQGVEYGAYDDRRSEAEYCDWLSEVLDACDRVLSPQGSIFLNLGGPPSDPLKPHRILTVANTRFVVQNVIHWAKAIALGSEPVRGHVKPINSPRYLNGQHEYVFHLTRRGDVPLDRLAVGVPYADENNLRRGTRGRNGNVRCRGNVWWLPYETIQRRATDRPHPASFPPALPEQCIRLHGIERTRLVLDPFMGIGATAVACARLEVACVGFEIDPEYAAVARERAGERQCVAA